LGKAVAFLKEYPTNYFNLAGSFTKTRGEIDNLIKEYKEKIGKTEEFFNGLLKGFVKTIVANNFDFTQCGGKNIERNDMSKKPNCEGKNPQNWNLPERNDWMVYHNGGVDVEGFEKFDTIRYLLFLLRNQNVGHKNICIVNHNIHLTFSLNGLFHETSGA